MTQLRHITSHTVFPEHGISEVEIMGGSKYSWELMKESELFLISTGRLMMDSEQSNGPWRIYLKGANWTQHLGDYGNGLERLRWRPKLTPWE